MQRSSGAERMSSGAEHGCPVEVVQSRDSACSFDAPPPRTLPDACRRKSFAERLKRLTAPNSTARQALLKEAPKRSMDAQGQAQAVKEMQAMLRAYCNQVAGAKEAALCKTSREQDMLRRASLSARQHVEYVECTTLVVPRLTARASWC